MLVLLYFLRAVFSIYLTLFLRLEYFLHLFIKYALVSHLHRGQTRSVGLCLGSVLKRSLAILSSLIGKFVFLVRLLYFSVEVNSQKRLLILAVCFSYDAYPPPILGKYRRLSCRFRLDADDLFGRPCNYQELHA